jgi:hypothetical protein
MSLQQPAVLRISPLPFIKKSFFQSCLNKGFFIMFINSSFRGFLAAAVANFSSVAQVPQPMNFKAPKRRNKTGVKYPHSSTRQQARYKRQLAAGQLCYVGQDLQGR